MQGIDLRSLLIRTCSTRAYSQIPWLLRKDDPQEHNDFFLFKWMSRV